MTEPHFKRPALVTTLVLLVLAASFYLMARTPLPTPASLTPSAERAVIPNPVSQGATSSTSQKIIWSEPAVTIILLPGDIKQRSVTFTSSASLRNASVEVVPEIAPFLSVMPSVIVNLSPNQKQPVQLRAMIPVGAAPSSYDGTIHVREQNRTIPQTLKVLITVGVPPDPGTAGNATLAGIDSDGDGVRDDVQRYIDLTYPQSAKERAALTQVALALEAELTGGTSGTQQRDNATDCLDSILMTSAADVAGGKIALDVLLSLRAVVLNTPDRAKAFARSDSESRSAVSFSTPYSQKASRCSIDPSLFPN